MIVLYSYNVSPYAAKIRSILNYKKLPFTETVIHPLKREPLKRVSGQEMVPVVEDGGRAVVDSTRIAQFLDEKYPERPILPRDAAARARVLLAEDWADETLAGGVQPARWLLGENGARTQALFRSAYPPGRADDLAFVVIGQAMRLDQRRKYGSRAGALSSSEVLKRLARVVDVLDTTLAETGFMAGATPTVADFAAWGFLQFLDGLDGWETVQSRAHVKRWTRAMAAASKAP